MLHHASHYSTDGEHSEAAVSQLRTSASPVSAASASVYGELHTFIDDVTRSCRAVEDIGSSHGSIHLISLLETVREKTWVDMKAVLSTYVFTNALSHGH